MTAEPSPLAAAIEARIRTNHLIDIPAPWADELIFPHYGGLSILNLIHSVAELLGVPMPYNRPLDSAVWGERAPEGISRVVLIIADGLSYRRLTHHMAADPVLTASVDTLSGGRGPLPLTSVVPSTTATALTTLWTGVSAAAHGLTGFTVYLRWLDMLTIPLFFRPCMGTLPRDSLVRDFGVNPMTFLPVRGFAEHLAAGGVPTYALVRGEYIGSALTAMLQRGIPKERLYVHTAHFDEWLRLRQLLAATRGQRCYVNIYLPGIDGVSHTYGADSPEAAYTIRRELAELADALTDDHLHDGHTLVMLTADHGHYNAPNWIDIYQSPPGAPLADSLRGRLSGEARLAYAFVRDGRRGAVIDALERHFADRVTWLDSAAALEAGLLGPEPPYKETAHRIGDLILIPRLGTRLEPPPEGLLSVHGGLSEWEMLVPFLWRRL